ERAVGANAQLRPSHVKFTDSRRRLELQCSVPLLLQEGGFPSSTKVLEDTVQPLSKSFKYYVEFLRDAAVAIEKRRYPRLIVKLFKEIKEGDDPRGLKTGELTFALNQSWSPNGRIIVRKTAQMQLMLVLLSTPFQTELMENS
ncbi:hypothetical protein MKX03_029418, partial [Papaver bracteatum]